MKVWSFKENSLELIRLIAAAQVMVLHTSEIMMHEITNNLLFDLIRLFPGVPIFFFISGFLISRSFEKNHSLSTYFKKRGLRIFPALIACVFINILMVWSTGYFETIQTSFLDIFLLFLGKISILQFYNPDFMRAFGDGVLNGSLWTICVELQFYVLVPVLYHVFKLNGKRANITLILLIVIFIIANRLLYHFQPEYSNEVLWKLYRVSFVPWIYMFLFGVLVQKNFHFFSRLLYKIKIFPAIAIYLITMYMASLAPFITFNNSIPPYIYFPLVLLTLRISYSFVEISRKLLKGNDISYGIYIWHMPIANQLIFTSSSNQPLLNLTFTIVFSVLLAFASWFLIEKRALKMKNFDLTKIK
jgi:peptidoglycan/LPS O-acetylase OafA/YrhL